MTNTRITSGEIIGYCCPIAGCDQIFLKEVGGIIPTHRFGGDAENGMNCSGSGRAGIEIHAKPPQPRKVRAPFVWRR